MTIALTDIAFLESNIGIELLAQLAQEDLSDASTLRLLTNLRKDYTAEQSRAGLEMARLRTKALVKFGSDANTMFFTRDALEQASDPLVRHYRAARIGALQIVDACCGIGADSLAFTATGAAVTGIDQDTVRIAIACHNASALGLNTRFEVGDVRAKLPDADVIFFDPGRRDAQGRRIYDIQQYLPPLSTIHTWKSERVVIKLSPGVDLSQLADYDGQIEFISVNGDLKEAVLWRDPAVSGLAATLLTPGSGYHWEPVLEADSALDVALSEPRHWLIEPDPALLRAGLVQDVAAQFNGFMLDATIAYVTADVKPASPWLRAWRILDWMPFNLKRLKAYLRQHQVGQVTVKKRGTAVTPETLIPQLKLKGSESRVLVLTRCKGQQIVMICAELEG